MKYFFLIIPILLLCSSCASFEAPSPDPRIVGLEGEIEKLKEENVKLQENITLMRNGAVSDGFSQVNNDNSNLPEGVTFDKSTPNTECIKKAQDAYIEAGNTQCRQQGYTEEDMRNRKCKLSKELIKTLLEKRTKDELACGPS